MKEIDVRDERKRRQILRRQGWKKRGENDGRDGRREAKNDVRDERREASEMKEEKRKRHHR